MKLILRGEKYDLESAISDATLQTLKVLAVSSQRSGGEKFDSVTIGSIMDCFTQLDSTDDYLGLFGDPAFLSSFQGLIFLARRKAGEPVTFDECGEFSLQNGDISFDVEDEVSDVPKDQSDQEPQ